MGNRNELKINEIKFDYGLNALDILGFKKLNQILLNI
jgi:hypothetical protein